jgi:hypothetical protein
VACCADRHDLPLQLGRVQSQARPPGPRPQRAARFRFKCRCRKSRSPRSPAFDTSPQRALSGKTDLQRNAWVARRACARIWQPEWQPDPVLSSRQAVAKCVSHCQMAQAANHRIGRPAFSGNSPKSPPAMCNDFCSARQWLVPVHATWTNERSRPTTPSIAPHARFEVGFPDIAAGYSTRRRGRTAAPGSGFDPGPSLLPPTAACC